MRGANNTLKKIFHILLLLTRDNSLNMCCLVSFEFILVILLYVYGTLFSYDVRYTHTHTGFRINVTMIFLEKINKERKMGILGDMW